MKFEQGLLNLYLDYVALKQHFAGKLEYHVDILAGRLGEDQIIKRADFKTFLTIANKFGIDRSENVAMLVSLFLTNPKAWIGDALVMDQQIKHNERLARLSNLSRIVSREAAAIVRYSTENSISFRDAFFKGDIPPIIKGMNAIKGGISLETLAVADSFLKFTEPNTLNPWWRTKKFVINRYAPLIAYQLPQDFINQEFQYALH